MREATLSMLRRVGADELNILTSQNNLACTYSCLGRNEEALRLRKDVYSACVNLEGEEAEGTLLAANNYASSLKALGRFEEARSVLRKTIPVSRRCLGEGHNLTLIMRWTSAKALFEDPAATLDDLREAVTMLKDLAPTARRVLGGAHPTAVCIECHLRQARAALRARETPSSEA